MLAAWAQFDSSGVIRVAGGDSLGSIEVCTDRSRNPTAAAIRQVSVAVNSSGAAIVGWIRKNNDLFGHVITRPAVGSFGTPTTIATGAWPPALQQLHPLQVAIDAAGCASAA